MLSDEEKKTIDKLKNGKKYTLVAIIRVFKKEGIENFRITRKEYLDIILNLIEKQSNEIEELKEDRDKFKKALGKRITYCNELEKDLFENCSNYVVSKDKIKEIIEKLEKEQEDNRKELYNAINNLYFKKIDIISNRICVNMSIRDILQSLLE